MADRGADRATKTAALPLRLLARTGNSATVAAIDRLIAAAFATAPQGMAIVDSDGRLHEINRRGEMLLPEAQRGRRLSEALAPQYRLGWETALAGATVGTVKTVECQGPSESEWLEVEVGPLAEGFLLASVRNVEVERRLQERAVVAQRHETFAALASGLAHDFNNILAIVIGNSELLAEQLTRESELAKLADVSLTAAHAGAELTRLLLAAGKAKGRVTSFCAGTCLNEWRGLIERSAGSGITVEIRTEAEPWNIVADQAQFASALLNLTLNARDAMAKGGTLTFEVRNLAAAEQDLRGDAVTIAVRDTGSGIPASILDRVFDPFFTTKKTGSGLGLAMVRDFAQQAGGEVRIDSRPDRGTTVRMIFPRAPLQLGLPYPEADPNIPRAAAGETVLVVSPDPAMRTLLKRLLQGIGYAVFCEADDKAALALAEQLDRLDLVVADLPADAAADTKLGRGIRQHHSNIKLLLVSAQEHDQPRARTTILTKPFSRRDLAQKMRAILDGRLAG